MAYTDFAERPLATGRIDWVDYAKGLCIILVVMMHSTLGVQEALGETGFMNAIVEFAKPFRMPDFFLLSGLFLARVINRDFRTFFDRRVLHFIYFYILWLTIQAGVRAPGVAMSEGLDAVIVGYLWAFIEPFGTLWFIYILPIFALVCRALRHVHPALLWVGAAVLEMTGLQTGWLIADEFAARFVYFVTGYVAAPWIFRFAAGVAQRPSWTLGALAVWAILNQVMVSTGLAVLPVLSLALGFLGAAALIAIAALLARFDLMKSLAYAGANSIVIYLAFFLPMAITRVVLLKTGIITDAGLVALLVTIAAVVGPLIGYAIIQRLGFGLFLFHRPAWASIENRSVPTGRLHPAE